MKEPNDISSLFSLFNSSQESQYREITRVAEQHDARDRWPLFKEVPLGNRGEADTRRTAGYMGGGPAAEFPHVRSAPSVVRNDSNELTALFDRLKRQRPGIADVPVREPVEERTSPSMRSLFSRLKQS